VTKTVLVYAVCKSWFDRVI